MIKEPWFWREASLSARTISLVLAPAGAVYSLAAAIRERIANPSPSALPVICIGNAALGGSGKTPFAIMLGDMLLECGMRPCFVTRGYGGTLRGPLLVAPETHTYLDVGDEALLLAKHGPVIIAKNRNNGIKFAAKQDCDVVVMDDGFQNPTVAKDVSILLLPAVLPENRRTFPAGPWREPISRAKTRADIIITVVASSTEQAGQIQAWVESIGAGQPEKVVAFCGIANPERFLQSLEQSGYTIAAHANFPDHHPFTRHEVETLIRKAHSLGARAITTEKDHVRIAPELREQVLTLPVEMRLSEPDALLNAVKMKIEAHKGACDAR